MRWFRKKEEPTPTIVTAPPPPAPITYSDWDVLFRDGSRLKFTAMDTPWRGRYDVEEIFEYDTEGNEHLIQRDAVACISKKRSTYTWQKREADEAAASAGPEKT